MEWCWVIRHPQIFHGLTGCQWSPKIWGVTLNVLIRVLEESRRIWDVFYIIVYGLHVKLFIFLLVYLFFLVYLFIYYLFSLVYFYLD